MEMRNASVKATGLLIFIVVHFLSFIKRKEIDVPQVYLDEINRNGNFFYVSLYALLWLLCLLIEAQGKYFKFSVTVCQELSLYMVVAKLSGMNMVDWGQQEHFGFWGASTVILLSLWYKPHLEKHKKKYEKIFKSR